MSGNNHNKLNNLFELKNSASGYAQLVEAQSPEPQSVCIEVDECKKLESLNQVDGINKENENGKIHQEKSDISSELQQDNDGRKQSSSFSSSSIGKSIDIPSTTSECSILQETVNINTKSSQTNEQIAPNLPSNNSNNNLFNGRKVSLASSQMSTSFVSTTESQACSSSTVACYPTGGSSNLKRAISQSMLKLDQSNRMERFEVIWKELSYSYEPNLLTGFGKKATPVLHNISGGFKSNRLVAIIGPSGCGKTTLLQFLAGNNPRYQEKLRIIGLEEPKVAFIGQDDCLLPGLTTKETLIYASRLQNNSPNFDHELHVQPILEELGLSECVDRSVKKLSGGQAKRVTIAQELLYPTNLLVLDEVTSGLDASTSYSIVKLLKQLVSDNEYPMSIVMSIHQPSARLFSVFDQVYVMSEGCCLYEGSCNVEAINIHLKQFDLECPKFHNIADYLIEIASDDNHSGSSTSSYKIIRDKMIQYQRKRCSMIEENRFILGEEENYNDTNDSFNYATKENLDVVYNDFSVDSQKVSMLMNSSLFASVEMARSKRERPMLAHMKVHFARSLMRIRRSYILTYLQLVTYILLGLQLATFYGSDIGTLSGCPRLPMSLIGFVLSKESEENLSLEMRRIQENMNFLLVAIMTATFAALEITVITFPLEAKTVKREWRNGWYRVSSYFMGRTLADLPFQLLFVIVFCTLIYTLTGQLGLATWRFLSFVTIIVMTALIAQTVGFIFGALFMDNLPAAVFTAPLCIFPALLFSGFFSRVSQIPSFYKPMTYLSHFRYAFDALLVTLYGYDRCNCDEDVLVSYHASLTNQTSSMIDMFKSLFGSADCLSSNQASESSIEDLTTTTLSPNLNIIHDTITMIGSPTVTPAIATTSVLKIKTFEDSLVESVFQHISSTSTSLSPNSSSGEEGFTAIDKISNKFADRVTSMLNTQSNFGHPVPLKCSNFNPYLMTEFDLHNEDLLFGLIMLLVVVVLSRLLCNFILTFTIATRTK